MNNNEHNEVDSLERIFKEAEAELKKNPKNVKALFNLTLLKVPFIKQNPHEILKDLLYLYKKLPSKKDILANYIAQCYAELDDFDKAYSFAKEALKLPEELRYEGYFTLIQVCMFKGKDYFDEALEHLNEALKLDVEDEIKLSFYSLKLELFIRKQDKKAFDDTLNETYLIYGNKLEVTYEKINGMLSFNVSKEEKESYIEELDYLVEQHPEDFFINIAYVNLFKQLNDFDKALLVLDNFEKVSKKQYDQLIREKLDLYILKEDYKTAEAFLLAFKESTDNKLFANLLLFTLYSQDEAFVNKTLKCVEEIYEINPIDEMYESLCSTLINLDERIKLVEYSLKHLERNPNHEFAAFCVGQNGALIGNSYDDSIKYFERATTKYEFPALNEMLYRSADPKKYLRAYNKKMKKAIKLNNPRVLILLAEVYLKGEFRKPNPKLAKKLLDRVSSILSKPLNINDDVVEIIDYSVGLTGRYYEIYEKDYKTAAEYYEQGGTYYFDQPSDVLNQGAYYVHKYLKGIGTEVNYDIAIKKLKELNEEHNFLKANVIYLEAYLSLLGKYDKDVNLIINNLENDYYFARYDLNRYVLLKQLVEKFNKTSSKLNELDFDKCFKYAAFKEKEHYNKHKNDDVFYPFI